MSDKSTRSRSASTRSRQRRSASTRGPARPPAAGTASVAGPTPRPSRAASSALARRFTGGAPSFTLSREMEYAYIRSDLQRLAVIAGGLLVLMLVILVVIER